MNIIKTEIPDVLIIQPKVLDNIRRYFLHNIFITSKHHMDNTI